jgi:hypothetical protein
MAISLVTIRSDPPLREKASPALRIDKGGFKKLVTNETASRSLSARDPCHFRRRWATTSRGSGGWRR